MSVPELVRRAENRPASAKRPAPDRGSRSPLEPAPPAAKRPVAESPAVELSASALTAIRQMLDSSIAVVIKAFEAKFDGMEKRLQQLEGEAMDKDMQIDRLGKQLSEQLKVSEDLQARVEAIDLNRRLSSLILTCDEFGRRSINENIEETVVKILNERISGLALTTTDIQVAHRLQRDNKVICKFAKRSVRDRIFDARFDLQNRSRKPDDAEPGDRRSVGSVSGRPLPPLYLTESLTSYNQWLYNQLLQVRKSSGGSTVASVFSRRGLVYCRTVRNGPNIRVTDDVTLQRIISGADGRSSHPSPGRRTSVARPVGEGRVGASRLPRPVADSGDTAPPGPAAVTVATSGTAAVVADRGVSPAIYAGTGGDGAARDPSLAAETLSGGTASVSPAAAAAEEGRRGHTAVPAATRTGTADGSGAE